MIISLSPTSDDILTILRSFLLQVLAPGSAAFRGSISGTTLTVTKVDVGQINPDDQVFGGVALEGAAVAPSTFVVQQLSGTTGGIGTYQVDVSQAVSGIPLTTGIPVILGQDNRVPEPSAPSYVVMTPIGLDRLATNVDTTIDCFFQGAVATNVLTVASVDYGSVLLNSQLFGVGVPDNTFIRKQLTGSPNGAGTYRVSTSSTIASQGFACGVTAAMQETKIDVQLDFHGVQSWDQAQQVSTLFRDSYAVDFFLRLNPLVTPLYADGPHQAPFVSGEKEYENRWIVEAAIQANQTVKVPQEFAATLTPTLIEIDTTFPAH